MSEEGHEIDLVIDAGLGRSDEYVPRERGADRSGPCCRKLPRLRKDVPVRRGQVRILIEQFETPQPAAAGKLSEVSNLSFGCEPGLGVLKRISGPSAFPEATRTPPE